MSLVTNVLSIFRRDILLLVVNFSTGVFVARSLGPGALGVWVIMSLLPSYAEGLGRLKVDVASVYLIGKQTYGREIILFNMNVVALLSAFFFVGAIIFLSNPLYEWFFRNITVNYRTHVFILLLQIPLNFLYLNLVYFFIAEEKTILYNRIVTINALLTAAVSVLLLSFTSIGLWSLIVGAGVGLLASLAYGNLSIDRSAWVSGSFSMPVCIALLRYGVHFYIVGILAQLQASGTQLLTAGVLLPEQLGFLNLGQIICRLLDKFTAPLNVILFSRMSRGASEDAIVTTSRAFRVASILIIILGLGLAVIARVLVNTVYGISFQPTVAIIYWILPGAIFYGACSLFQSYFNSTGRAGILSPIMAIAVVIQLYLTWVFTNLWGVYGSAAAMAVGMIVYCSLLSIAYLKSTKLPASTLIPRLEDFKYIFFECNYRVAAFFRGPKG
jgi:O-antigen/teichoic acid export membrane protein